MVSKHKKPLKAGSGVGWGQPFKQMIEYVLDINLLSVVGPHLEVRREAWVKMVLYTKYLDNSALDVGLGFAKK